jgi:membrane peptidoglycan carboxypeptidase
MSEHRRKPPRPQGGGRAAARRGAQPPPSGRRAGPSRGGADTPSAPHGADLPQPPSAGPPSGGRAQARRAAQAASRGGRRRAATSPATGHGRAGGRGGGAGPGGRRRLIDYPRAGRTGVRRWVPSWRLMSGLSLTFLGCLVVLAGASYMMVSIPTAQAAAKLQNNVYYWSNGTRMVTDGGTNRQIIPISDMPESMQNAVISAENETFRTDSGIDPKGILRSVYKMATGGEVQSGSTITQQYVKNTYLNQQQTLSRKFKEMFISIKVGTKLSKDDIMEGYLNTSWFGRGSYGLQAASQAYYGKDASKLNPSQCAFLAALLKGEGEYNPDWGPRQERNAKERWQWILDREVKTGLMTRSESDKWIQKGFPMPIPPKKAGTKAGQIGYLVDLANHYITQNSAQTHITEQELNQGGFQIHTTFDKRKMAAMENAVSGVLKENIHPKERAADKYVQVGGASVVPGDGAIVAIYGGKDWTKHFTDNADTTGVGVGSTFKPFVLAAAMSDGVRDPNGPVDQGPSERTPISVKSLFNGNSNVPVRNYDGTIWTDKNGPWRQKNDDNHSYGWINLRTAMQFSVNTPYIQLGMDVGLQQVKDAALAAGLRDDDQMAALTPSFSLGNSSPSAIRMAGAYATFAAQGEQTEPYSVKTVQKNGVEVFHHQVRKKQAFSIDVADNVTDVLTTVVKKGTGTPALKLGRPAAGKTGTTDQNNSAWFTGYTPQLATSIGMFRKDDRHANSPFKSMRGVGGLASVHGASFPTEIWTDYMIQAVKGMPVKDFPKAAPIGKKMDQKGAPAPKPTVTATPSQTPSAPASSAPPSEPPSEPPTSPSSPPTTSCPPWGCKNGGTSGGTTGGGTDGGTTTGGGSNGGGGNGGGGNGGLFGGANGG